MAQGYLWSSEFWFHVLFLAAFLGLSIIMIIVGIVDAWQESRPTKDAADLAGFARCKKCGRVDIGHPFKGCVKFTPSR